MTLLVVIVKVAVVAPAATVTDEGRETFELLSLNVTFMPPLGAGPESVTVPVAFSPPSKAFGLTVTDTSTGRKTVNDALALPPLKLAATVTVVFDETALVVIVALPVVAPSTIVSEPGVPAALLLSEREIVRPPLGAAAFMVTVTVFEVTPVTESFAMLTELMLGGLRVSVPVAAPFKVAVMVAVVCVATELVVTVKVALV